MIAFERLIAALQNHGCVVKSNGHRRAQAQCPAHDDGAPSLSLTGIDGSVLVYCHAGCHTDDVLAALGLTSADLFDSPRGSTYTYPDGRQVQRTPEKKFWQSGNTKGRSLFRTQFGDVRTVYVVEGEKDVLAIEAAGGAATCGAMGAGKADKFDWSPIAGKHAVVIADKDEPGRKHADQVATILKGVAASVRIVQALTGKDAADHLAAGHGLDEFEPVGAASVDGSQLLDDVEQFLGRFVVYPSEHEQRAHALWIAHTWFMDHWESTPRIAFLSPEPGSGKSRALEVTEPLVPRPVHAVNTTPAYLFRKVSDEAGRPTILYDEIDTVFGPKAKDNEDIRGMLNAGHRQGATAGRCVIRGKIVETEELPAYCAVALAGLDDLPDTIMTRAVVVRMRRRAPGERVEPWRPRINNPEAHQLRARLEAWAAQAAEQLTGDFWPDMPAEVVDRDADVWEALLAVADLAGERWAKAARVTAVTAVTAGKCRKLSIGVLLLRDIKKVFDQGRDKMPTEDIITGLTKLPESPWATIRKGDAIDALGLANRLRGYGIGSKSQRTNDVVFKGYARAQFIDAWARYVDTFADDDDNDGLPAPPYEPVTSVTSVTDPPRKPPNVSDVTDVTGSEDGSRCRCGARLARPESVERGECAECSMTFGVLS